jgi:hypothetical protein
MPAKKETTRKSTAKKSAVKSPAKPDLKNFLMEVEKKAYDLYQERIKTSAPCDDIADWFQAEREIKKKYNL